MTAKEQTIDTYPLSAHTNKCNKTSAKMTALNLKQNCLLPSLFRHTFLNNLASGF